MKSTIDNPNKWLLAHLEEYVTDPQALAQLLARYEQQKTFYGYLAKWRHATRLANHFTHFSTAKDAQERARHWQAKADDLKKLIDSYPPNGV